jgi:hypothetical protein
VQLTISEQASINNKFNDLERACQKQALFFGNRFFALISKQGLSMDMHQALIKNFNDYLAGTEVEAAIRLKENETVSPGDHVLVMKDNIAAATDIPVPRQQQSSAIGVEGTITEIQNTPPGGAGSRIQKIRVVKL